MKEFRTYVLSKEFFCKIRKLKIPRPLGDQLRRASASVALNLAEGYGRSSLADQRRFFSMALGSVRECQAVFDLLEDEIAGELRDHLDHMAASVWRLINPRR
jgi:four helix bundle protein